MYEHCRQIETTSEVCSAIAAAHDAQLVVFDTFSDPTGLHGKPKMYTAWGFSGTDFPLIEIETTWDRISDGVRVNVQTRYWLLSPIKHES